MRGVILDLFSGTGGWSKPYQDAGYEVIGVDLKFECNVLNLISAQLPQTHGILAAPPCTDFANSGAQYFKAKDVDGRTAASLKLIDKTLALIQELHPAWWALENPIGRLPRLRPNLGKPVMYFQPYEYGDPYTKRTALWGKFNINLIKNPVEPQKVCAQGSWVQRLGGKSERTKTLRSITPPGFAKAFFEANP
jgi:hypothetical protein